MEVSEFLFGNTSSTQTNEDWELLLTYGKNSTCYKCHKEERLYFKKTLNSELLDNMKYRAAYRKEFCLGFAIENPYIVKYNKIIDTPEECTLLLDYIDGNNLEELINSDSYYFDNRKNLVRIVNQLLLAMRYLHQHQIIHMDLKPANIMISKMSGDIKIVDLGFCYSDSYQDTVGTTQAYSANEVRNGNSDFDVRTDIYGFGIILQYIQEHSTAKLPHNYKRVMDKCLAEDKNDRYSSVDEILDELFNKARRSKIITVVATIILLAVLFFSLDAPRYIHRSIYGYDFADDKGVLYNILDKDSMTCSVVGYNVVHDKRYKIDYGHVVVPELTSYKYAHYRIVEIADSAFYKDSIISMVSIMPKKIVLGKSCFSHAFKLQYVTFAGEARWHEQAFYDAIRLTTIDYPHNLRVIPYLCFYQNNAIQHLNLPEGITTIDQDAFVECRGLVDAHLPSTLETLGRGVFYACPKLEEVHIPAATKSIGMFCFMFCPKLKRIYNHATTPQKVSSLFDKGQKITVFVPRESVDKYRQAECWKEQDIVPMQD